MVLTQSMHLEQWLQLALMGGIFGLLGQLIRTAMGMRKLSRSSGGLKTAMADQFSQSQLLISLMLGILAGIVATFTVPGLEGFAENPVVSPTVILTIMSAGYAGGDFLEGIVKSQFRTGAG
ncbi:hypothetical protein [Cognatiyoonia sp. IB215182]|uniref:hypothetical protein n=1 Tax=Cognatiyoonia sp. IB215182 TaxID=3097353 RepID=UPI002A1382C6|nr:hypothetical protein [Cognatiyoonia sp. IB215182]MDX8355320.1 hypothetical protein [Cognatiyoonia sp. IB215182]